MSEDQSTSPEQYGRLQLLISEGTTFVILGHANVPLDQNWAKKAYQKIGTQFRPLYNDHSHDTYGGWTLNKNRIAYCRDLGGLAEPNNEPLDAVTLQGIHLQSFNTLSDMPLSQQSREKVRLQFLPLVLHYDLDTDNLDNTTAWVSTQTSDDQIRTLEHTKFAKVQIDQYFDGKALKKRFTRFRRQLKRIFK